MSVLSGQIILFKIELLADIYQESTTGIIDLQDDEPEIVKLLIDFLYTGNFDISTDEQVEKVETNKGDGSSNVTDTLQDDENSGSGSSEDLITAVKVYIIADKYDIHPLKLLSKTKYEALLPSHWNSSAFIDSLKLIFDETTENDRLLKDVVVDFAGGKSRELMERSEFVNLLKDNAEMAVEIFKASLLKAPKVMLRLPNPACAICGSSTSVEPANKKFQQATTNPGDMVWWCSSCRCRFA